MICWGSANFPTPSFGREGHGADLSITSDSESESGVATSSASSSRSLYTKMVFTVGLIQENKKKVMNGVSSIQGIHSIGIDTKDNRLTVIAEENVNVIKLIKTLKKICSTQILSVGPLTGELNNIQP